MKDYKVRGSLIDIFMENGASYTVSASFIEKMMNNLDLDMEDALLTWLEDNGKLINDEQEELDKKTRGKVKVIGERKIVKKTQKERVHKDNPTKEAIISAIAAFLQNEKEAFVAANINIENKGKIITFTVGGDSFKIDLVQKRKAKEEK